MNLEDVFGDFEYVYNFGPSSLKNGIIDVFTLQQWVSRHYIKNEIKDFSATLDDYLIENRNRFYAGKIYSFFYDGKGPDLRPMFLSITNMIADADKLYEIGINLNYLLPKDRVKLLKGIVKAFPNQLKENIDHIERGQRRQEDLPFIHAEYRKKFFDLIEMKPKMIKIDRSKIMRNTLKAVDYKHWKFLVYYLPQTFVNTTPQEVYKEQIYKA
jgi:hypothetical protein